MALLRHGNVKFSDTHTDPANDADGLMTLARPSTPDSIPVYFSTMPFLLDNTMVREIVESMATLTPQKLAIVIDDQTHKHHPDLMLSMQAYCVHNDDVINLDSIEIATDTIDTPAADTVMVVGSDALLRACLSSFSQDRVQTIIYFPDNIDDQLALHALLELDSDHEVIPVISTGPQSFRKNQGQASALINVLDIAIAHDAQLFHWVEGNASQLAAQQSDVLSLLLTSYLSVKSTLATSFLSNDEAAIEALHKACAYTLHKNDIRAMMLLIKARLSVLHDLIPEGSDARIWHLLSTLGHTLYFNELPATATTKSTALFDHNEVTLLADIGELSTPVSLKSEDVKTAMLWLKEQHRLHNR